MSSANNSTSPAPPRDPTTPLPSAIPPTIPPTPPTIPPTPPTIPPGTPTAALPTIPPATPPNTSAPNGPETTILETVPPSGSTVVVTRTSTATPSTSQSSTLPATTNPPAAGSSTTQPTNTLVPNGGGSGMSGTTTVVVAVVVPIIGVALIAIALLFMWKRRQKTKANAEARRKEVEEYGYNPNNDPHGGAAAVAGIGVARSSSNEETLYEMAESDATGYRGWGSTNGGRKALNMGSSVGTSGQAGMGFSDGGFPQQQGNAVGSGPEGYTGVATSPSASTFPIANSPSVDGSNAPLIHGNRPATADSSVIGTMNGPVSAENSGGIHRGISNASSNYSAMTQSDQSDLGQPLSQHDAQYYGVDDGYEEAYYSSRNPSHSYPGDNGYGPAPVIRDVSARRNTRIETPTDTHFPQQGNSGIAQNF